MGPLFGAVLARALTAWWEELGRPDPFVVVEAGAGRGTLARTVLDADPPFMPALRYLLVERSDILRQQAAAVVAAEPPALVLGAPAGVDEDEEAGEVRYRPGQGPRSAVLGELPAAPLTGVVLANELLDNLAFDLVERTPTGWMEVRVGEDTGRLVEVLVEPAASLKAEADRAVGGLGADLDPGARLPIQHQAAAWLRQALALLTAGRVVVIDYADDSPSMAGRPADEWLRTYRGHGRGGAPLDHPGEQDVTCEVAVDQLTRVQPAVADRAQADFLRAHGLDELVAAARAGWEERAAVGDLAALKARSRVGEGAALTDPAGLGAFRVVEWVVPHPGAKP